MRRSNRSPRRSAQLAPQFSGVESLDDALEVMQEVLPQFLPEFRSLIEETRVGLEELEAPSEVLAEHDELLALYDEFIALIDDAADQLERGEAGAEVLQTFVGESSGTALGMRFIALANRLASIAATNGIEVELNSGPLVADFGRSTGRGGEPTVVGVETASPGLTGIAEVDAVFDAITRASYYNDCTALEALVRFTTTECTERLGIGGPPKCLADESEQAGTLVEVFPFSVCEGQYVRRGDDLARLLQDLAAPSGEPGLVERAYAVYDLHDTVRTRLR